MTVDASEIAQLLGDRIFESNQAVVVADPCRGQLQNKLVFHGLLKPKKPAELNADRAGRIDIIARIARTKAQIEMT